MTDDKGYGSDTFREFSANKGGKSVISKRNDNNTPQVKVDWCLYRHLVENNFEKLNTAEQYKKISKELHQYGFTGIYINVVTDV